MKNNEMNPRRNPSGTFLILNAVLALFLLLPLGVLAFEIGRLYLALHELRGATDAAVLAGASVMFDGEISTFTQRKQLADKVAIDTFRKNFVLSNSLSSATTSTSVTTDSPAAGQCTFQLILDQQSSVLTAHAALGVQPAFASFLGLGTVPVRAHSSAGGKLRGDVVLVVDISNSMTGKTATLRVARFVDPADGNLKHQVIGRATGNNSEMIGLGAAFPIKSLKRVPDPNSVNTDFTRGKLLNRLANASFEVKIAALVEAKAGNLENATVFQSSGASSSLLAGLIQPGPGFQDDYQRIALAALQPLEDERQAIARFLTKLDGTDVHVGLVTFARKAGFGADAENSFSTRSGFIHPVVNLSRGASRIDDVIAALETTPTFLGTATASGLNRGAEMIEGPGHTPGQPKTIILLTDGLPTRPGDKQEAFAAAKAAAKRVGAKGIRLYTVGFFQIPEAKKRGPKVLNKLVQKAGNGARAFVAPSTPELNDVLDQIAAQGGGVTLINH